MLFPYIKHNIDIPRAIQHKREITLELINYNDHILTEVKKLYNNPRIVEKTGQKYKVISIREKRGEAIAFYFYYNGKVIVRIWTHDNNRLEQLKAILYPFKVVRELMELYIRYHEKSERRVETILDTILRKYGKSQSIKYHMHKTRKIAYINRLNKFEINGLTITIKTYRHRAYSNLDPKKPEYHPKLELAILKKDEIKQEDVEKALAILYTIVKLAKVKQIWSEYDKQQHKYPLRQIDIELYKILKGTLKRVKAINILGKEYYDINHAILDMIKKGYKIREIARILGYSHVAILKRIWKLEEKGIIKKIGRGKYQVVEKLPKPIVRLTLSQFREYKLKAIRIVNRTRGTLVVETTDTIAIIYNVEVVNLQPLVVKQGYRKYRLEIIDGDLKLTPIPL